MTTETKKLSRDNFVTALINANADKGYQAVADLLKAEIPKNYDVPPRVSSGEVKIESWIKAYIRWAHKVKGATELTPPARIAQPKVKKAETVKVKNSGPIKAKNGSLAVKPKNEGLTVEEIQDRNAKRLATIKEVGQRYKASTEKLEAQISAAPTAAVA